MTFIEDDRAADAAGENLLETPTDTGFSNVLGAQVGTALKVGSLEADATIPQTFEPDARNDVGYFESLGAAFADNGIVTGAAKAGKANLEQEPLVDDFSYDIQGHLEGEPELLKTFQPFLDDPASNQSEAVLGLLENSRSEEETRRIAQALIENQENAEIARANGWVPQALGFVGGIGVDVAATILMTGGAAAGPLVARTGVSARALAAGRVAALGAVEGGLERGAQSLTNPLVTDRDILTAVGFGGLGGGALGALFPRFIGNVRQFDEAMEPRRYSEDAIDAVIDQRRQAQSVGAARSPDAVPSAGPAIGGGSKVAGRVPGTSKTAANIIRSPKRVITDIGARAAKTGDQAGLAFYNLMNRAVRLGVTNAEEVGGKSARAATVQDYMDQGHVERTARSVAATSEYNAAMKEVFDIGPGYTRTAINTAITPGGTRLRAKFITQEEYEAMADEFSIANHEGNLELVDIIPESVATKLTTAQRDALKSHIEATAAREDDFYQTWGEREVAAGLLKEEELIPGYRPQRWNADEVENNPDEFEALLLEAFQATPDETFIQQFVTKGLDDVEEAILGEGETFAQLKTRDPELADEILDEWNAAVRDEAIEKRIKVVDKREAEIKRLRGKSLQEIEERIRTNRGKAERLLTRYQRQLENLGPDPEAPGRERLVELIGKTEKRLGDEEAKYTLLRQQTATVDQIDDFIRRFGDNKQKRKLPKARRAVAKATRAETKALARRTVREQIAEVRRAILARQSPFAFLDDAAITSSSRFQRRNIHLGRQRHTPAARKLLRTSTQDARIAYDSSVGAQVGLRKVFGEGGREIDGVNYVQVQIDKALEGYEEALKTATGARRVQLQKDQKRNRALAQRMFAELTGADMSVARLEGTFSQAVRGLNTLNSAMALGGVVIASIGDAAVTSMAGGQLGTGFRAMWRGPRVQKHLRAIAADDDQMAVIMQGLSTLEMGRFRAFADLDYTDISMPGGRWGKVQRMVDDLAVLEGHANFLSMWSKWIRGGFGLDFARQIDGHFADYGKLSPGLKGFYAKLGIDDVAAGEIADLMNRSHRKYVNGKLRIPDSDAWVKAGRDDLLTKYKIAMKAAGDEAMLDPGIGDRPFMRANALGRLILQFQSFMFTASDRFIGPLVQNFQLNPTEVRPYFAALAAVGTGIMVDGLKASVRGDGEEWERSWDAEGGLRDHLWAGMLRSPIMAGASSTLTDIAFNNFGRGINEAVGTKIVPQPRSRFQEQQGLFALAGPVPSTLLKTFPAIAQKILDGDFDDARKMAMRKIPVINTFYLQALARIAEGE